MATQMMPETINVIQTMPTVRTRMARGAGFSRQMTGLLLLAVGRGWAAGVFTPGTPWWTYLVLSIPVVILLALSLAFFRGPGARQTTSAKTSWAAIGLHVYAGLSLILAVGSIVAGQSGSGSQYFGVKTPAELVPTVIIALGALVWLTTLAHARRGA